MSGAVHRVGLVLALTMVGVLASTGAASADRTWGRDRDERFVPSAAAFDIDASAVANRRERLKFMVNLERVRRGKSKLRFQAAMAEQPRWSLEVTARWPRSGEQRHRLYVATDASVPVRVRCRGMESRWDTGRNGHVVVKIPHTCLDGPHSWKNFRVETVRGDGFEDRMRSRSTLDPEL